jgi:hypothetical protein
MLYDTGSPQVYPVLYAANQFLTGTVTPLNPTAGWNQAPAMPSKLGFGIEICTQAITPSANIGPYTIDPYIAGTYASWARLNGCGEVYVWVMDCTSPPNTYAAPPNKGIPTASIAISLYQIFLTEIINAMYMPPPAPGNYPVVPNDENSLFYLYTMSSPPNAPILNPTNIRPPGFTGNYRNGIMITDGRYGFVVKDKKKLKQLECAPCRTASSKPRLLNNSVSDSPSAESNKPLSLWLKILIPGIGLLLFALFVAFTVKKLHHAKPKTK